MLATVWRHYKNFFDAKDSVAFLVVFILLILSGLMEVVGVASVMPFFSILMEPSLIQENARIHQVYELLQPASANVFAIQLGCGVIALLTFSTAVNLFTSWRMQRVLWSVHDTLSEKILKANLALPYEELLDKDPSTYSRSILSDVEAVVVHYFYSIGLILSRGIIAAVIMALIAYTDIKMALLVISVFGGLYFAIYYFSRKRLEDLGKIREKTIQSRFLYAAEIFAGAKEIKVQNPELHIIHQYMDNTKKYSRMMEQSTFFQTAPRSIIETIGLSCAIIIVMAFLANDLSFSNILPSLVLFAVGGYRLLPSLQTLYGSISMARVFHPLFLRLSADLEKSAVNNRPPATVHETWHFSQSIRFIDVDYRYPRAEKPAITGFNATFRIGEVTALIGPSGAGKSTLMDMLLGLLLPEKGAIAIDGRKLDDDWVHQWRGHIGYVPQHSMLLNAPLSLNIGFSAPEDIDLERVKAAAALAQIDSFIAALPDGYDTKIGESGYRLSGGQRQRLIIARALYRDPDILIMDEPTSSLDHETQDAFVDSIRQLRQTKTIIIISHSAKVAQIADNCILLDGGQKVTDGSPANVMMNSPLGRRLLNA